jgi:hypothetical protein
MLTDQQITRRTFLKSLMVVTIGGTAAALGLGGCKPRNHSTPQSYYTDHRDDILKDNKPYFTQLRTLLADKLGESDADAVQKATIRRFDQLLPGLPYIGGGDNDLTTNLENSAAALAFYQELKSRGIPVEETGRLLFQAVASLYSGDMMNGVMGRLSNSSLAQDKLKKDAETSHQKTYTEDWVFDFIPGNSDFDFGIDYTECGICKYFKAQNAAELTPYMCLLDAPVSRAMNTGLVRTQTLARGDARCDFCYKSGRTVQVEWDPGFVNGGK